MTEAVSNPVMAPAGPLEGVVVIEAGEGVALAFCCKLLADFGATVVKIEDPKGGDVVRRRAPVPGSAADFPGSTLHLFLNANKLGVSLDLEAAPGRELLQRLLDRSDIFAAFSRSGAHEQFEGVLSGTREDDGLVSVVISWLGLSGPWRDFVLDDFLAQHLSGMAFSTAVRRDDLGAEPPLAAQGHLAEMVAGLTAATAAITGLFARAGDGRGERIDVAIVESLASFLRHEVVALTFGAGLMSRHKRAVSQIAGVFQQPVSDGYVDIMIRTEKAWRSLVEVIGSPDWANLDAFATHPSRAAHWDALEPLLQADLARFSKAEIHSQAQSKGVAVAPVNSIAEAAASLLFSQRRFFAEGGHPQFGQLRYPGPPFRLVDSTSSRSPAPGLGQDNQLVFGGWLGCSAEELARLASAGVL